MNRDKNNGFTLIEVLISIFLLAVMLAMASGSFLGLSPKYRLKKAVWEINTQMNYSRYKAIFNKTRVRIRFGTSSYSIEEYKNIWVKKQTHVYEGVSVQANNTPTFHPNGTVSNLASIYISNSWGRYRITIAISGRIKIVKI